MWCWKKRARTLFHWPMTVKVFAPAKINLTLHVTGRRKDGYHLIDSLVAFAPVGDNLTIKKADSLTLTLTGPEAAGVPTDMGNLVMETAAIVAPGQRLAMALEKNLPVAAGIGGGSADAAAVYRGLFKGWGRADLENLNALSRDEIWAVFQPPPGRVVQLGADIPVCITPCWQRVRGVGEQCEMLDFPTIAGLLVNPRIAVSTAAVFQALEQTENAPMPPVIPEFSGPRDFAGWLAEQRNDLAAPALKICPQIGEVLDVLRRLDGCLLARMSGSGATCFALFETPEKSQAAKQRLQRDCPDWWLSAGSLGNWAGKAMPRFS